MRLVILHTDKDSPLVVNLDAMAYMKDRSQVRGTHIA